MPCTCGILVLQSGVEPMPPTLEAQVLTTEPPGKFQWEKNLEKNRIKIKFLKIYKVKTTLKPALKKKSFLGTSLPV